MVLAARTINSVFMHSMLVVPLVSLTRFRILLDYILRADVSFTRNEDAGGRQKREKEEKERERERREGRGTTTEVAVASARRRLERIGARARARA
jgi:hypothetical protein